MSSVEQKMTTKSLRLDTKGVAEVMAKGRAYPSGSFLLKFIKNASTEAQNDAPRVAYIASKKIFKTAVLRNKAKRRGRAALQAVEKLKSIKNASIVAFLFKKEVLDVEFEAFKQEISQILQKTGLLC